MQYILCFSVLKQKETQRRSNASKKTSVVLKDFVSSESVVSRKSTRQRRDSLKILRLKKFKSKVSEYIFKNVNAFVNLSNQPESFSE